MTIAVIWWGGGGMPNIFSWQLLKWARVSFKGWRIVLDQFALVLADVLLLRHLCNTDFHIGSITWVSVHVNSLLYQPVQRILPSLFVAYLSYSVSLPPHVKGVRCTSQKTVRVEAKTKGWEQGYSKTAPLPLPDFQFQCHVVHCKITWQCEHTQCLCEIQERV